jgi:hypothetical protein
MILALSNAIRKAFELNPIKVTPYMITKSDLADLGHAQCHQHSFSCSSDVPAWLVNGWASCNHHLADTVRAAADFNRHHRVWLG